MRGISAPIGRADPPIDDAVDEGYKAEHVVAKSERSLRGGGHTCIRTGRRVATPRTDDLAASTVLKSVPSWAFRRVVSPPYDIRTESIAPEPQFNVYL